MRLMYSGELISGIETAAKIFGIDNLKIYKIENLTSAVVSQYEKLKEDSDDTDKQGFFEQIADEKKRLVKITNHLLNGDKEANSNKLINQIFYDVYNAACSLAYFYKKSKE